MMTDWWNDIVIILVTHCARLDGWTDKLTTRCVITDEKALLDIFLESEPQAVVMLQENQMSGNW